MRLRPFSPAANLLPALGLTALVLLRIGPTPGLAAVASAPDPAAQPTANLARSFSGAGAFLWDAATHSYQPAPVLDAIIDDDVGSGWTPPTGKTQILVRLSEDADLSAVSLFAPGAGGRYSISVAADADAVAAGDLKPVASKLDLATVTQTPVDHLNAAYVVIDLDVAASAPLRSVQAIGRTRLPSSHTTSIVAPKTDASGASGTKDRGEVAVVNFALKAVGATVPKAKGDADSLIDGDTATGSALKPGPSGHASTLVHLASAVDIDRVALAVGKAVGEIRIFATDAEGRDLRLVGTLHLDGSLESVSLETAGIQAEFVRLDWQPGDGASDLLVKEVGVFAEARITRSAPPEKPGAVAVEVTPVVSAAPALPAPATTPGRTDESTPIEQPPVSVPDSRPVSF